MVDDMRKRERAPAPGAVVEGVTIHLFIAEQAALRGRLCASSTLTHKLVYVRRLEENLFFTQEARHQEARVQGASHQLRS